MTHGTIFLLGLLMQQSFVLVISLLPQSSVFLRSPHYRRLLHDHNGQSNQLLLFRRQYLSRQSEQYSRSLSQPIFDISMIGFLALTWNPLSAGALDEIAHSVHSDQSTFSNIDPRYFIAGGFAASFSHGIATPFDVIKTRIQTSPELNDGGLLNATFNIIRNDGVGVLLVGLLPTLLGYGVEGAVKFGIYESLKPVFINLCWSVFGPNPDHTLPYLASSVIAGSMASIILCPMEAIRIQSVTNPSSYSGFVQSLNRIVRENGFASIFSGLSPMLLKQVPYTMAKQVSFDTFTALCRNFLVTLSFRPLLFSHHDESYVISLISAIFASLFACIVSHPGDVLLTETYRHKSRDVGVLQVISDIYAERGINGFFTGISARVIHVGAIITSQLVLYDSMKQSFGLPATGT